MSANHWEIDPAHTRVEFGVKHMMFTTVRGRFAELEGAIELDPSSPEASSVRVDIPAAGIDTGLEARDEHLRSPDFFDVGNHPTIRFRSSRVTGSLELGGEFEVEGELTIRGVTREVTLTGTFEGTGADPWGGTRAGFSASTTIDRRDYGLTWNQALEAGGILVGNDVKISLQVQAVLQEELATV